MIFSVKPVDAIKASFHLPASKSYSIRAFLIAACGGTSTIIRPSNCQDAVVAMKTAKALGAKIVKENDGFKITASAQSLIKTKEFQVGESGTTLRFLLPLLPFYTEQSTVDGKGTLIGRPNFHLCETLRACGLDIKGTGKNESVPIQFKGGLLPSGKIVIDGSLSSQFISALLIAGAKLDQDLSIHIAGKKIVSCKYITMTRQIMEKAGVKTSHSKPRVLSVKSKEKYKGLKNFVVPSDYGLAAFFLAAAAIVKSDLTLKGNLSDEFIQADGEILPLIKKMGVKFIKTSRSLKVKGPFVLKGGVFSLKDCPDLLPILAVLALFAKTKTKFIDIGHARIKESDRISDLRQELLKVGAKVHETASELIIEPLGDGYKSNVLLNAHNDHRLAMAFAVLGLRIGTRIEGMESSHKSYPDFVKDFKTVVGHRS